MALPNHTITLTTQEKRMPLTTWLRDTFFGPPQTYVTEEVDVEYCKGGQEVAPFVAPNIGGINIGRDGFYTKRYTTPRIAPQRALSKDLLNLRMMGENVHSTMTPAERAQRILVRDARELDEQITRREEVMAAQLITTGRIEVKGFMDDKRTKFVDESVDYGHDQITTLSGNAMWSQSGSKKYDDLAHACEKTMESGFNPNCAVLGIQSYKYLLDDESFLKKLDINKLALAYIAPTMAPKDGSGVKYIGRISDLGIDLYAYYAWYRANGALHKFIPDNKVIILPGLIGEYLYGAITQMEDDKQFYTYEGTRIPKEWADVDNDTRMIRISSRPLARPFDVNAWSIIDTYTE